MSAKQEKLSGLLAIKLPNITTLQKKYGLSLLFQDYVIKGLNLTKVKERRKLQGAILRSRGEIQMYNFMNKISNGMTGKTYCRALLPALIISALASASLQAQSTNADCVDVEGTPPGLYATTDQGRTFLMKGDKVVELAPGQAAFADETKLTCIKKVPAFLDWPCTSVAAQSRMFSTYKFEDLNPDQDIIKQVVKRYFEVPEVIQPFPKWIEGEFHTTLSFKDIIGYSSAEYWYKPDSSVDIMNEKRPKTLLISLYVGINQVVIDNYAIDPLHRFYGNEKIPVVFVFNDSNVVPVSYFGSNVSLEEVHKAFNERHIKLAEVPLWPLGDHHFSPTAEEFEKYFDLPDLDKIDKQRREAIEAQLDAYGFSRKPIFVTMLEGGKMYVDDPDRVRIAIAKKMPHLQTVINFVEEDSHLARCGPGNPVGSHGVSGTTTPIGGAVVPPTAPAPPPPPSPEPPASGS